MNKLWLFACVGAAAALSACTPPARGPLKPLAQFNCPEEQGSLTRVSASATACSYKGEDGETVDLKLVNLTGSDQQTLAGLESGLRTLLPAMKSDVDAKAAENAEDAAEAASGAVSDAEDAVESATSARATGAEAKVAAADARAEAADAKAKAAVAAANANRTVTVTETKVDGKVVSKHIERHSRHGDGHVKIDLPGIHIDADGDNDGAKLNIGGVHINADGSNDAVHISRKPKTGWGRSFTIDANNSGAVIRVDSGSRVNVKSMLILASDKPGPNGDRVAGYIARGPRTGPLVVATIRALKKEGEGGVHLDESGGDLFKDAGRLVKKNAGG